MFILQHAASIAFIVGYILPTTVYALPTPDLPTPDLPTTHLSAGTLANDSRNSRHLHGQPNWMVRVHATPNSDSTDLLHRFATKLSSVDLSKSISTSDAKLLPLHNYVDSEGKVHQDAIMIKYLKPSHSSGNPYHPEAMPTSENPVEVPFMINTASTSAFVLQKIGRLIKAGNIDNAPVLIIPGKIGASLEKTKVFQEGIPEKKAILLAEVKKVACEQVVSIAKEHQILYRALYEDLPVTFSGDKVESVLLYNWDSYGEIEKDVPEEELHSYCETCFDKSYTVDLE
ncbi:hypothetical protein J3R30DRAFT_2573452 [Lentinula aciculospora]|uniref:Uncharacterized protein n=1 Tax=Lentinula aciculospora TaxID=153920 RepID=A0A9W9AE61_9AGAR|nr:hypothetical protein J3R30DRAFT_2573452 [Lentinula aciculospora]